MKLRNKKTGEIVNWEHGLQYKLGKEYASIKDFVKDWEDYEDPKEYWFIDIDGEISTDEMEDDTVKDMREIGNYFETREEAEKAAEKLKAWKRLKDKGFRFVRIDEQNEGHRVGQYIEFEMAYHFEPDAWQIGHDLDLLFGGEE